MSCFGSVEELFFLTGLEGLISILLVPIFENIPSGL